MSAAQEFQFKQFRLAHGQCAHKIGTDSILLGAWAQSEKVSHILDVGSGSGILSFMLAQKYPQAEVTGIELDEASFLESLQNLSHSPFRERVQFIREDFKLWQSTKLYDLIISNPPYFAIAQNTKRPERDAARRQNSLSHSLLLQQLKELLHTEGSAQLILPSAEAEKFRALAFKMDLFPNKICRIRSLADGKHIRELFSLQKQKCNCEQTELVLYEKDGSRTQAFAALTQDFYL